MDTAAAFHCLSDSQRQVLEEFGRRGVRFIVFAARSLQALNAPRIAARAHRDLPDAPGGVREQYRKDLEALNAEAIDKGIQGLVDAANGVVPSGKDKVMPVRLSLSAPSTATSWIKIRPIWNT